MADKKWEMAVELRGKSFKRNLETYKLLTRLKPPKTAFDEAGHGKVCFVFVTFLLFCMRLSSFSIVSFEYNISNSKHYLSK